MSAPMTLEEAVREVQADGFGMCSPAARAALLAHAERTVAARSGEEPEGVRKIRQAAAGGGYPSPRVQQWYAEAALHIDALTAELDAARQEFAEWLDAFGKGLEAHAEVVDERERLAAMVERVRGCERIHAETIADTYIDVEGECDEYYVRSCDLHAALKESPNG
jgi:hypothetical protein